MRVALVAPEIPDYALEYALVVAEQSEVLLYIPDKFRGMLSFEHHPKVEVRWTRWPRQRSLSNLRFMAKLAREIGRWRADVVHCLDGNYVWLNFLALLLKSKPFVTTIHDATVHPGDQGTGRVPRITVRLLVRLSVAIVVHGEKLKQEVIDSLSAVHERIFVFPHPPLTRYSKLANKLGISKSPDSCFRVLFFGRIQEYKGLSYLIKAATTVRTKAAHVKFVVAGRGDISNYLPTITDRSSFEIHNHFLTDEETARLFAESDIVALPYIEASQSGVLLLALSFGLPVVVTDVGEMGELVRTYGIGLVVPARDHVALASAILKATSNSTCLDEIKANMRLLMDGDLSYPTLSDKAHLMYQRIITLHGRSLTKA